MSEANERFLVRRDDVVWREVKGETVVLDLEGSVYLSLNSSATLLWNMILEGASHSELVDRLIERFGISSEQATADVTSFLEDCRRRKLLQQAPDRP